jgi:hypothetical protein
LLVSAPHTDIAPLSEQNYNFALSHRLFIPPFILTLDLVCDCGACLNSDTFWHILGCPQLLNHAAHGKSARHDELRDLVIKLIKELSGFAVAEPRPDSRTRSGPDIFTQLGDYSALIDINITTPTPTATSTQVNATTRRPYSAPWPAKNTASMTLRQQQLEPS